LNCGDWFRLGRLIVISTGGNPPKRPMTFITYRAVQKPQTSSFRALTEIREHTEIWLRDYNEDIPHDALNDFSPAEYRQIHHP